MLSQYELGRIVLSVGKMSIIKRVHSLDVLKLLGNPVRLSILRLLLTQPYTISQLGEKLGKHPAQIRNHIVRLQKAGMIVLSTINQVQNYIEIYYQATAHAFFVNMAVLPESSRAGTIVVLGSDDLALDLLASQINDEQQNPELFILPVGSMDGLIYLREHYCHMAGCHLIDMESGEYNIPYVQHIFPDETMVLVTLAYRLQGLMVRKGNPDQVHTLLDIVDKKITFINRKRGSGTRLWLDKQLRLLGIKTSILNGYQQEVSTDLDVAYAVNDCKADVGLGVLAAARQADLDFIPLFNERFDLVMTDEVYQSDLLRPVIDHLHSEEFKQMVDELEGYSTVHTGEVIKIE